MKSHNKFLASAIAVAIGTLASSAFAGNMSTTTRYLATENFGPTQAATVTLTPAAVSYSISSAGGVTVTSGQTITLYLRLSGTHTFTAAPAAASFSKLAIGASGAPVTPTVTLGTDANANTVAVTYTAAASTNLPANTAIVWTPAGGAITAVSAELATAGGNITISGSLDGNAVNTAAATLPSSQDPVAAPVTIATSAQAITGAVQSSGEFTARAAALPATIAIVREGKQIDLGAATGVATAFATPAGFVSNTGGVLTVNLGSYTFTNNASVVPTTLSGAPYQLPAASTALAAPAGLFGNTTVTITPDTGKTFPIGATFALFRDANCTTGNGTASGAVTALTASAPVNLTAANTYNTGLPSYVCMTVPGTLAGAISPITPTIAVSLAKTTGTDAANTIAATPGYALVNNGRQIDVTNYVPAAVEGWTQYLRVVNTGALTADVSAAVIDESTGLAGPSSVVISGLKAGATVNLTSADVEAKVGALAAGARPRIRITAPTTGMNVMNMLFTPNGSFTNNSAQQ